MILLPLGFEGEGDDTTQGGSAADKTYTQAEFDHHMGGIRKKYEGQLETLKKTQEQLAEQLKTVKDQPGLAEEEREALQLQIESLEASYLTKQQRAEQEAVKKEKALQTEIEAVTNERSLWKNSYETEIIRNQIYRESSKEPRAHDPEQMARILGPDISWKDIENESGDGTRHEPRVSFADTDKEGKPVTLELTIEQAMARMRELPNRYGNLFDAGNYKAGEGGSPSNSRAADGQQLTPEVLKDNPKLLRKLMKENPKQFGLV